jgi:peptidoglycan L-alanyl-D-glutamate endopeptidase CwlK
MKMDARSEAVLANVSPDLAAKVRAAAGKLATDGTFFLVVSGLRTASEQNALYAQGRTTPGHIVSNARAGYSMHNYGLAVDAVPFLSGDAGALNWQADTPQFRAMVAALESQDLVWGGDWKTFPDDDHFQMPDLPDTPNSAMRADYGDGTQTLLATIWDKADAGVYSA